VETFGSKVDNFMAKKIQGKVSTVSTGHHHIHYFREEETLTSYYKNTMLMMVDGGKVGV